MARHIKTGELGEKLALDYFQKKGYVILEQNWRYSHWEVDIIASHNEISRLLSEHGILGILILVILILLKQLAMHIPGTGKIFMLTSRHSSVLTRLKLRYCCFMDQLTLTFLWASRCSYGWD